MLFFGLFCYFRFFFVGLPLEIFLPTPLATYDIRVNDTNTKTLNHLKVQEPCKVSYHITRRLDFHIGPLMLNVKQGTLTILKFWHIELYSGLPTVSERYDRYIHYSARVI